MAWACLNHMLSRLNLTNKQNQHTFIYKYIFSKFFKVFIYFYKAIGQLILLKVNKTNANVKSQSKMVVVAKAVLGDGFGKLPITFIIVFVVIGGLVRGDLKRSMVGWVALMAKTLMASNWSQNMDKVEWKEAFYG